MVHLALLDRVAQGAYDVLLPHDVRERARAVTAIERRAGGHGKASLEAAPGALGQPRQEWTVHPRSKLNSSSALPVAGSGRASPHRLATTA